MNLIDRKIDNNKAISKSEIKQNLHQIKEKLELKLNSKIIALGKTASYGLTLAEVHHFALPHPSGLCRFWNDPAAAEVKIREMFIWISGD
jgi:uracil-DNA glycosylase